MPLSRLPGVGDFCSNLLSPFLPIVCILSSQTISFQILLHALFPQFPWLTLLPISSYFSFHNLMYLVIDVSTHDMTIPPQTALNYHILDLHNNTHPIMKNISRHPINQSYPTHNPDHSTLHPMQSELLPHTTNSCTHCLRCSTITTNHITQTKLKQEQKQVSLYPKVHGTRFLPSSFRRI